MCETEGLTEQSIRAFGSQRHSFLAPLRGRLIFLEADVCPGQISHIAPANGIARVELKRPFHLGNASLSLSDKIKAIADGHGCVSEIEVELES